MATNAILYCGLAPRDEIISRVEECYQDLYSSKKKLPKPDINIDGDKYQTSQGGQKDPERYKERQSTRRR